MDGHEPGVDSSSTEDRFGRRPFLQGAAGAGLVLIGACYTPPRGRVMPYARRPENLTPGVPLHFATAHEVHGYGVGLLVQSCDGRPVKVEGNPEHPFSLGAAGPAEQALTRQLYDPSRPRALLRRNVATSFRAYLEEHARRARALEDARGAPLRFLLGSTASPLLLELCRRIRERFPRARIDTYHPLSREALLEGARIAYGEPLEMLIDYSSARVLVALDADPVGAGPTWLRDARGIADARDPGRPEMLRLWVAEPAMTVTGMYADHRLPVRPSEVEGVALALLRRLAEDRNLPGLTWARELPGAAPLDQARSRFVAAAASDLARHGERSVVVAGPSQPPRVHALAHAINEALGSNGSTIELVEPGVQDTHDGPSVLARLAGELRAGEIDTLVVTAFDPVYSAPGDVPFADALSHVDNLVVHAHAEDFTARSATWLVPAASTLESWGDVRAMDGTASIVQPLIAPIFDSHTEAEVLAPFAGVKDTAPHDMVRSLWQRRLPEDFARRWDDILARGLVDDTRSRRVRPRLDPGRVRAALAAAPAAGPGSGTLEVVLRPSYTLHDGRYALNAWLQELPDPVTKQSWGNAALIAPATARSLDAGDGRMLRLAVGDTAIELPALSAPGTAEGTVAVALGHGRPGPAPVRGVVIGANGYLLRRAEAPWAPPVAQLTVLLGSRSISLSQVQPLMEGHAAALSATRRRYEDEGPAFLHELKGPVEKLYKPFGYEQEQYVWAMAIDLNRCTGCTACVVACQAENSIPVVGPEDVGSGRIMHWIRIDRYFEGDQANPASITQPVACQHCEAAPCEYVCPVNATVHSDEGLNEMVYNRCVGTRWCSNNCPYKVRRFNWRDYHQGDGPLDHMSLSSDVTARARGVMEKCSYCVQRIERARIEARRGGAPIDTRALQTACQQACPTRAIAFGSLHDEGSRVAELHRDRRRYDLLHALGTRPRTVYLARIRNPDGEG